MPRKSHLDIQWQANEYREDMKMPASKDWLDGPGSISKTEALTITWKIEGNLSLSFGDVTLANVGATYSVTREESNSYTVDVAAGKRARMTYMPYVHHINGWMTVTQGNDPVYEIDPQTHRPIITDYTPIETVVDHQWVALYFPLNSGVYGVEYSDGSVSWLAKP